MSLNILSRKILTTSNTIIYRTVSSKININENQKLEISELIKMNNLVSGIARCWNIPHQKFHYKNINQKYDLNKFKNDQSIIFNLKKHPVFIIKNYFIHQI